MLKTFTRGGVHPAENKLTKSTSILEMPLPETVIIPLSMHLGTSAKALVEKGHEILTGQLIAENQGIISSNIHSSVSGVVQKIDKATDISGYKNDALFIDVKDDIWIDTIDRSDSLIDTFHYDSAEIIEKIKNAGIVGMGGATFPTHIKLSYPRNKKAEYLIINGVECEPFLTSDHALMLNKGAEILVGVRLLQKAIKAHRVIIGIECNKADAIDHLKGLLRNDDTIEIQALKVKYPQGGEKQLIQALTHREVPHGRLPIDVGAVVFNVGTSFAVYEAVQKNKPLFERIITVTGKSVKNPANFRVRLGTPIRKLIEAAGGLPDDSGKILLGGPMMGKAISDPDAPVIKGSSGIVILNDHVSQRKPSEPCIRCSRCIYTCPMGLEPYLLMVMSQKSMLEQLEDEHIMDCIECGSCSYTCPANRPLLDYIRLGKLNVGKMIRSRKK